MALLLFLGVNSGQLLAEVVEEAAHFVEVLAAGLDVVPELDFDLGALGAGEFFSGGLELLVEAALAVPEGADEGVVVVAFAGELLELLAECDVVVVEVLEEFALLLEFGLVLGDGVLQADFALVGVFAVVLEVVFDRADLVVLRVQFAFQFFLGLVQGLVVVFEALDGGRQV